jgi:hypothetical protein
MRKLSNDNIIRALVHGMPSMDWRQRGHPEHLPTLSKYRQQSFLKLFCQLHPKWRERRKNNCPCSSTGKCIRGKRQPLRRLRSEGWIFKASPGRNVQWATVWDRRIMV